MSQGIVFDETSISRIMSLIKFDKLNGLIPIVAQDHKTNEILMVAFANEEALRKSLATGKAHYWSRSRNELWEKGSQSGHFQYIQEILLDCDEDTLIFKVKQVKAACHTGYYSCFYRRIEKDVPQIVGKKVFDPESVYKEKK